MKAWFSNIDNVLETRWFEGGSDVVEVWFSDTTCSEVVVSKTICGGEFGRC